MTGGRHDGGPGMIRRLMTSVAAAAVFAGVLAAPEASAAVSGTACGRRGCVCDTYKVTGKTVAVRRPAWNDAPVTRPESPVDHYVHRGDVLLLRG